MPMATAGAATPARSFALRLIAWSLGLFGLLRLPWVAVQVLLPATRLQAAAGAALLGPSTLPIDVTLACSGADALALCLGAILAYPASWRMRAGGVALGTAGLLALNTLRIGTLGRAVASPYWFNALHVYIWPAALTLAIGAFVFAWMRWADGGSGGATVREPQGRLKQRRVTMASTERQEPEARLRAFPDAILNWRFALTAAACLLLFTLAAPLYLESARVLAVAQLVARAAAWLLGGLGVTATAAAGVLNTPRGAFLVTQECISTPLIPVYAAAILVYPRSWPGAALWALAGAPLFFAIGVARLLVVALPAGLAPSPAFMIHAFSQLLVAAGMVCGIALWRYGARPATWLRAAVAIALAIVFVQVLGAPYTQAIRWCAPGAFQDAQGALLSLPAFQFGLFLALWIAAFVPSGWTRFLCGAALLAAIQIAVGGGVQLLVLHAGVAPLVRDIRAWALICPALIIATVVNLAPARR